MFWKSRLSRFLDFNRVKGAIEDAERRTSGEIRVSIAPFFWGDIEAAADRAFARLGMTQTTARNGVLFFIVPSRRSFVVRGDTGIADRVPPYYWKDLVALMSPFFRSGNFTDGVLAGIRALAEELSRYFPYDGATDRDELSNVVDIDDKP